MAQSRTYTVVEADHYDQQEGLVIGALVEAEPLRTPRTCLSPRSSTPRSRWRSRSPVNKSQLALA